MDQIMYIKYSIILGLSFTAQSYSIPEKNQLNPSDYATYSQSTIEKNKSIMEYNTMTNDELIENNNKQIMSILYQELIKNNNFDN